MAVRIGLAGAGRRATEVHAPILAELGDGQFAGVWARTHERARALADQHGVPSFDRFDAMLAECDAVAFAIPPAAQAELATHAVHHGKAVLVERPVAGDIAGAEELTMAVESRHVVSQVVLAWRYASVVRRFLAEDLPRTRAAGGSGLLVAGVRSGERPVSAWRLERGVLLDQGPDLLDLLDAALGTIVAVRARGDPRGWLGMMLDHQGGRFSEASLCASAGPAGPRADVEVFGPGGTASVDCTKAVEPDTFRTMYREFSASIESGTPPPINVAHGLHLQRVVEAAETDLLVGR